VPPPGSPHDSFLARMRRPQQPQQIALFLLDCDADAQSEQLKECVSTGAPPSHGSHWVVVGDGGVVLLGGFCLGGGSFDVRKLTPDRLHRLAPDSTIFRAIQRHWGKGQSRQEMAPPPSNWCHSVVCLGQGPEHLRRTWEPTYTVVYRAESQAPASTAEVGGAGAAGVAATLTQSRASKKARCMCVCVCRFYQYCWLCFPPPSPLFL
jgi:hypothetical protein